MAQTSNHCAQTTHPESITHFLALAAVRGETVGLRHLDGQPKSGGFLHARPTLLVVRRFDIDIWVESAKMGNSLPSEARALFPPD